MDFDVQMTLEGEPLSKADLKALLESANGLVLLKGKWVEVDRDKLREVLAHWQKVQSASAPGGILMNDMNDLVMMKSHFIQFRNFKLWFLGLKRWRSVSSLLRTRTPCKCAMGMPGKCRTMLASS
jgi:hypothetical protein